MWDSGWDTIFSSKDWGSYPPEELVRFIGRHYFSLPDRGSIEILELGCGTGANLMFLAQEGFRATGLDGSKVALEKASIRLKERGLEATLDLGDAMELPYDDESFECVIDIECVYANTFSDSQRILAEAHRVLKPGGYLFSKTFMTGTTGESTGHRMEGERNTFLEIPDGPFNKGYGVIRLTAEEDIPLLYGDFSDISVDFVIRSDRGRVLEVREWLITCRK